MKLHSNQFERRLKKLVRQTVHNSLALKREYRRVKRFRKNVNWLWIWRLFISALVAVSVWSIQQRTGHLNAALAGVGVYLLAALCFRIQNLWSKLYDSSDLATLIGLPVTTTTIFRWQVQKFFRESLCLLVDLLAIFGVLAWTNNFPLWKWGITLLFVLVTWGHVLALAAYSVLKLPRWPFHMLATGLIILGVVLVFGRSLIAPQALRLLDGCAFELNLVLPTAWPVAPFELLEQREHWWLFVLWLPVAFFLGNLKPCLTSLKDGFAYHEMLELPARDMVPAVADEELAVPEEMNRQLGLTEIEGIVASGTFLNHPNHPLRAIPEQKLWQWLNVRERSLVEFVHPTGLVIGAVWKKIYQILLALILLVLGAGLISPLTQLVALSLGAFVVFCMALASLLNHGRAFAQFLCGGVNVPMYAVYGIGFNELSRFFFKYALVQMPFLIGAFMMLGGVTAWCLRWPLGLGMIFGFKVAGLLFASRYILIVFAFSSGTNDTSRFRISSVLLVGIVVMLGMAFVGLGAASLFVPMPLTSYMLWAGAILVAWVFFRVYSWFYRFCRFDLMSLPK
jgi:hypothetical protein